MEDEKPNSEKPKTQTESSGGGSPPGKTRVGSGAEGMAFFGHNPPPKHTVWGIYKQKQTTSSTLLSVNQINKKNADMKEIALLKELFLIIYEEIHTHAARDAQRVSADLLQRVQKLTKGKIASGNET